MATCLFVASGLNFDVDDYLRHSPFKVNTVFHKGTVPPRGNPNRLPRPDSGFVVIVGEDGEPAVSAQLGRAMEFLIQNDKELQSLQQYGVDNMLLDLTAFRRHTIDQYEYFPPGLIQAMARQGMGMSVSAISMAEE